jgi:hypothetical protein
MLFTFYIQCVPKLKKNNSCAERLISKVCNNYEQQDLPLKSTSFIIFIYLTEVPWIITDIHLFLNRDWDISCGYLKWAQQNCYRTRRLILFWKEVIRYIKKLCPYRHRIHFPVSHPTKSSISTDIRKLYSHVERKCWNEMWYSTSNLFTLILVTAPLQKWDRKLILGNSGWS